MPKPTSRNICFARPHLNKAWSYLGNIGILRALPAGQCSSAAGAQLRFRSMQVIYGAMVHSEQSRL